MEDTFLQDTANKIKASEDSIIKAQDLINLLRESGEDTADRQLELDKVKRRLDKWKAALEKRGIQGK